MKEIALGLAIAATIINLFQLFALKEQEQALQDICEIMDERHVYEYGHNIPMDCETLTRL